MKLNEVQKKLLAWATFVGQIINGLIWFLANIPLPDQQSAGFVSTGQKGVVTHFLIGLAISYAQSFLPRVQRRRL